MGRTASTKEERQAKQRQLNQRKYSDPQKLSKKRENDRVRKRERYRQVRLVTRDPSILATNAAIQAQTQNKGQM